MTGQSKSAGIRGTQYTTILPKDPLFCFHLVLAKELSAQLKPWYTVQQAKRKLFWTALPTLAGSLWQIQMWFPARSG